MTSRVTQKKRMRNVVGSEIGAGGIGFDAKRWMEDYGLEGANEARAGDDAAVSSQRGRGRQQK